MRNIFLEHDQWDTDSAGMLWDGDNLVGSIPMGVASVDFTGAVQDGDYIELSVGQVPGFVHVTVDGMPLQAEGGNVNFMAGEGPIRWVLPAGDVSIRMDGACSGGPVRLEGVRGLEAIDDEAETPAGVPVTVDVLANDMLEGEPVSLSDLAGPPEIVSGPQVGDAVVNEDGTITYTPPAGFSGEVELQYKIATPAPAAFYLAFVVGDGPEPLEWAEALDGEGNLISGFRIKLNGVPVDSTVIDGAGCYSVSPTPEGTYLLFGHFIGMSSDGSIYEWAASVLEIDSSGEIIARDDLGTHEEEGGGPTRGNYQVMGGGGFYYNGKVYSSVGVTSDFSGSDWSAGRYLVEMDRSLSHDRMLEIFGGEGPGEGLRVTQKHVTPQGAVLLNGGPSPMVIVNVPSWQVNYINSSLNTDYDAYQGSGAIAAGLIFIAGHAHEGDGMITAWDSYGDHLYTRPVGYLDLYSKLGNAAYIDGHMYLLFMDLSKSGWRIIKTDVEGVPDDSYTNNPGQVLPNFDSGFTVDDHGRVYIVQDGPGGYSYCRLDASGALDPTFGPAFGQQQRINAPYVEPEDPHD